MSNLNSIHLQIIFPDVNDVNIKMIKKSQVTITGSIDGVYKARQQLIVSISDEEHTHNGKNKIKIRSSLCGLLFLLF